ncbi:MAG TPA: hypothetical protein DIC56_11405 [Rhizobium sp.]|nr:hypothetical protein [Rhizobium sp.]
MTVFKTETPATAPKVAFFPLTGRRDLIRKCAGELGERHGDEALTYWRTTCRALGAELLQRGCPEPDMRRQILDFQDLVQVELMAMHQMEEARG